MSYSPQTRLAYIPVIDVPTIWVDLLHNGSKLKYVEGFFTVQGIIPDDTYDSKDATRLFGPVPDEQAIKAARHVKPVREVIRAWDPVAQKVVWEHETSSGIRGYDGGVMSTAGNLVFQGRGSGELWVYAADTGKVLKVIKTGSHIMAAPMTYSVNGEQYVAVQVGYGGTAITVAPIPPSSAALKYQNTNRIIAFKLGGGAVPMPPASHRTRFPETARAESDPGADRGRRGDVHRAMHALPSARPEHHARSSQAQRRTARCLQGYFVERRVGPGRHGTVQRHFERKRRRQRPCVPDRAELDRLPRPAERGRAQIMLQPGLMMDRPLLISGILEHAEAQHGQTQMVSRETHGPVFRYTIKECAARVKKLANALADLGLPAGTAIASLAWNNHRHVEIYYAVSGSGLVIHTCNPRLHLEQLIFIINHAEDRVLFFDSSFAPLIAGIAARCPNIIAWICMTDAENMPALDAVANVYCYETFIASEDENFEWPQFDERASAAICYTSGTTGNPKGALYSHRAHRAERHDHLHAGNARPFCPGSDAAGGSDVSHQRLVRALRMPHRRCKAGAAGTSFGWPRPVRNDGK